MDFAFNEEQNELRSMAESFLEEYSSSKRVREAMVSERGYDTEVWNKISSELCWTSVLVPETYGGLGLSWVEVVALMEKMGESLLCSPFFSTVCLAGSLIQIAGSETQKQSYLSKIAQGELTATLAYTEANGHWDATGIEATVRKDGADYVLQGKKRYVLDGNSAEILIVAVRREGSRGEDGVSLFLVPANASGVHRKALATMDQTRPQAEIELDLVRVPASALLGAEGAGWPALNKALQFAAIALAAEQVGGAQKCLDLAVAYAKERIQFGRPIGSFQSIKHKCADMMVRVESARSGVYYAACVAAEDGAELASAASLAKASASDAYFQNAADAIQIHGGVGFTWEYDVHLYFKRAKSSETLFGDASYHRELVAKTIGLSE